MFPSLPARLLRLMSSAQILYKENINIFFLKGCVFVFSVIICVLLQLLNLLVLNVIFGVFEHSRLWNPLVPVLVPALVMDEVPGSGLVQIHLESYSCPNLLWYRVLQLHLLYLGLIDEGAVEAEDLLSLRPLLLLLTHLLVNVHLRFHLHRLQFWINFHFFC